MAIRIKQENSSNHEVEMRDEGGRISIYLNGLEVAFFDEINGKCYLELVDHGPEMLKVNRVMAKGRFMNCNR